MAEQPWGYRYGPGDPLNTYEVVAPYIRQVSKRTLIAWGVSVYPRQPGYSANGTQVAFASPWVGPAGGGNGVTSTAYLNVARPISLPLNGRYLAPGSSDQGVPSASGSAVQTPGGLPIVPGELQPSFSNNYRDPVAASGIKPGQCFSTGFSVIGSQTVTVTNTPAPAGVSWRDIQRLVIQLTALFVDRSLASNRSPAFWNAYGAVTWKYVNRDGLDPAPNCGGSGSGDPDGSSDGSGYPIEDPAAPGYPLPLAYLYPYWPNGCGFTRKRDREITTLAAAGEPGQRARFTAWATARYQDPSASDVTAANGGLGELMPATPADEYRYGTLLMDYGPAGSGTGTSTVTGTGEPAEFGDVATGTGEGPHVWHVSPDQATDPDILTFHGPTEAGDLLGPWIPNELYDAIEQLSVTLAQPAWYPGWYACQELTGSGQQAKDQPNYIGSPNASYFSGSSFIDYCTGGATPNVGYPVVPWGTPDPVTGASFRWSGFATALANAPNQGPGYVVNVPGHGSQGGPYASRSADFVNYDANYDPRDPSCEQGAYKQPGCPASFGVEPATVQVSGRIAVPVYADMDVIATATVNKIAVRYPIVNQPAYLPGLPACHDPSATYKVVDTRDPATTITPVTLTFGGRGGSRPCTTCDTTPAYLVSDAIVPRADALASTTYYEYVGPVVLDWSAGLAASGGGYGSGDPALSCDAVPDCVDVSGTGDGGDFSSGDSSVGSGGDDGGGEGTGDGGGGGVSGTGDGGTGDGGTGDGGVGTGPGGDGLGTGPPGTGPGGTCDYRITGVPIAGGGAVAASAFDDDPATCVTTVGGGWVGVDYLVPASVTAVAFRPCAGQGQQMVGGLFQASSTPDFSSDVHQLAYVSSPPPDDGYTVLPIAPPGLYRYARYLAPGGSTNVIAELQFYGCDGNGDPIYNGPYGTGTGTGDDDATGTGEVGCYTSADLTVNVLSNTGVSFGDVPAGTYEVVYVRGAYVDGNEGGGWGVDADASDDGGLPRVRLLDANQDEILKCPGGSGFGYATQAAAEAASAGAMKTFDWAGGEIVLQMAEVSPYAYGQNAAGSPSPTFRITNCNPLP